MNGFLRVLILPTVLFFMVSPVHAETSWPFELSSPNGFERGCYSPCLCPILISEDLNGDFSLSWRGFEAGFLTFEVRNIAWVVEFWDGSQTKIAGHGVFRLQLQPDPVQELQLELTFDGETQSFDSGLIPLDPDRSELAVTVNMNDFWCYDVAFHVIARPTTHDGRLGDFADILPLEPRSFGAVKARF